MLNSIFNFNDKNHLTMSGFDVCKLADKYGTPLYVMDENLIRKNCKIYKDAFDKYYGKGKILYASKAFSCKYMYKIIKDEGLGIDVVSGGELYTALKADFPASEIYFHGNNKTFDELFYAISNDVGRIVCDNLYELNMINDIAKKLNKKVSVLFRIKPGVDAHTHKSIMTGQIDSKFGFAISNGEAYDIIKEALLLKNIDFCGVHCHIGSQIFDIAPFEQAALVMLEFIKKIKDDFNVEIKELNLGGGYGIKYVENDNPVNYDLYIKNISVIVKKYCQDNNLDIPVILMEPGRSIVGESGITLYKVGCIKDIKNVRKYVSIDGGMCDNPRYALYESEYTVAVANKINNEKTEKVTIAGKCCESGDIIAKDIMIPEVDSGDIICVFSTGAYNYSMSSNYNRIPRPPVVMIKDGTDKVVVKRETYEDIVKNDI